MNNVIDCRSEVIECNVFGDFGSSLLRTICNVQHVRILMILVLDYCVVVNNDNNKIIIYS